jgi:hypothetical protein
MWRPLSLRCRHDGVGALLAYVALADLGTSQFEPPVRRCDILLN